MSPRLFLISKYIHVVEEKKDRRFKWRERNRDKIILFFFFCYIFSLIPCIYLAFKIKKNSYLSSYLFFSNEFAYKFLFYLDYFADLIIIRNTHAKKWRNRSLIPRNAVRTNPLKYIIVLCSGRFSHRLETWKIVFLKF